MNYRKDSGMGWIVVIFVIAIALYCIQFMAMRIDHDRALDRFADLAQIEPGQIVIIRHSNSAILVGDPMDVAYELEIDGRPQSGRCFASVYLAQ